MGIFNLNLGKKVIVYRSRDEADFNKAVDLLKEAGIYCYPFESEDMPTLGCGARINPARIGGTKGDFPEIIYRIEVGIDDEEKAREILKDKVLKVMDLGLGI